MQVNKKLDDNLQYPASFPFCKESESWLQDILREFVRITATGLMLVSKDSCYPYPGFQDIDAKIAMTWRFARFHFPNGINNLFHIQIINAKINIIFFIKLQTIQNKIFECFFLFM